MGQNNGWDLSKYVAHMLRFSSVEYGEETSCNLFHLFRKTEERAVRKYMNEYSLQTWTVLIKLVKHTVIKYV